VSQTFTIAIRDDDDNVDVCARDCEDGAAEAKFSNKPG
jgi:hypothetical protein